MTYKNIVKLINWLIKIANAIRMLKCRKSGECLCIFCTNEKCKQRGVTIDELLIPNNSMEDINNENS